MEDPQYDPALQAAAGTWNEGDLASIMLRIHDGEPIDKVEIRADSLAHKLISLSPPDYLKPGATIMEIGSGVGMIMEAMNKRLTAMGLDPAGVIGLDIADQMIKRAKERMGGEKPPYSFLHYNGVNVPRAAASLDMIYSVAALQHIPKPFVYNLFLECRRLLRP